MTNSKYGQTQKIRLLPDQVLFKQGDIGDKAYLINSGILDVIVDDKKVGFMTEGEFFGELALLLNQKRSATIIVRQAAELIEIDKKKFSELISSASTEVKKIILTMSEQLSKRANYKMAISKSDLESKIINENPTICAMIRQMFFRLEKSTSHVE